MKDSFGRQIRYLRLSLIDHCNLRCLYCMPMAHEARLKFVPKDELLTPAELETIAHAAAKAGFRKIRLTGGEPTLRPDLVEITGRLAHVPGIDELVMTTNGYRLPGLARYLAAAGMKRLNIHVDTLNPEHLPALMRKGSLERAWAGIAAAEEAGLLPIKLNAAVTRGYNDEDVADLARLTLDHEWHVRFIELMPLGTQAHVSLERYVSSEETRRRIEAELGPLAPMEAPPSPGRRSPGPRGDRGGDDPQSPPWPPPERGTGGRPDEAPPRSETGTGVRTEGVAMLDGEARVYRLAGAPGTVGFISPVSEPYCAGCNRMRVTADGRIRLCLLSDREIDLRAILRGGGSAADLVKLFRRAVWLKPWGHKLAEGIHPEMRTMSQIGG